MHRFRTVSRHLGALALDQVRVATCNADLGWPELVAAVERTVHIDAMSDHSPCNVHSRSLQYCYVDPKLLLPAGPALVCSMVGED